MLTKKEELIDDQLTIKIMKITDNYRLFWGKYVWEFKIYAF